MPKATLPAKDLRRWKEQDITQSEVKMPRFSWKLVMERTKRSREEGMLSAWVMQDKQNHPRVDPFTKAPEKHKWEGYWYHREAQ